MASDKPGGSVSVSGVGAVFRPALAMLLFVATLYQCRTILTRAYTIRLHSIETYGYIIHEFDPYFNFRAAQYLHDNGWKSFVQWFDYKSWYPLGRPVGTTIYPGMQVTAVWLVKSWLPVWFGSKEWLGMDIPRNIIVESAAEVANSLSSSGSNVMSMVASLMAAVGMRWNEMSLNDVCCLLPAWFGALATLTTGLLALECSANFGFNEGSYHGTVLDNIPFFGYYIRKITSIIRNTLASYSGMDMSNRRPPSRRSSLQTASLLSAMASMFFMSIVPAHIMRSVGGGYDNECVAMTAMTLVFYLWTRSLRGVPGGNKTDVGFTLSQQTRTAALLGALTGLAYFYMVAAWGGYIFVINLVGAHAATLILLGRHSSKLHAAYSAFYIVGTALATRVPVVGMTPLKSLEQLGPMVVFLGMQLVEYCERVGTRDKLNKIGLWRLRLRLFTLAGVVLVCIVLLLWPTGFFGPISSRVRGLFVKHTKTGNPLVDSVAEHQAAQAGTYEQYLRVVAKLAPVGYGMLAFGFSNDASSFLLVYGAAACFFSVKMVRLILLTAPIASVLGGMAVGRVLGWCVEGICGWSLDVYDIFGSDPIDSNVVVEAKIVSKDKGKAGKKKDKLTSDDSKTSDATSTAGTAKPSITENLIFKLLVRGAWIYISYRLYTRAQPEIREFERTCDQMAVSMSHPTILYKAQNQNDGRPILMDDYREAYWWLRDNTPEDARIMAWWDYGYQITAIANRTTIADGNTWNHEHIALLGRALTSSLKEGHRIARHLADYVLLWTGGGGDDLAKSPHLARIANSVYRSMCPGDPTCSMFGFPGGRPSPMLEASLLYRLHSNGIVPGVDVDKNRFKEVYKSKYGKVRIYKVLSVSNESKEWVLNNRVCDAPGSWFCRGQYPPGLQKVLKEKKDFAQLEDFNAKRESDEEYQRKYFEHLSDPNKARKMMEMNDAPAPPPLTKDQIRSINQRWEDNQVTSNLFNLIQTNQIDMLEMALKNQPSFAHARSKDGRGPMWWAHEHGRKDIIKLLKSHGVSEKLKDKDGIRPVDLADDEL